jgi:hypothetical protein
MGACGEESSGVGHGPAACHVGGHSGVVELDQFLGHYLRPSVADVSRITYSGTTASTIAIAQP